MGNQPNLSVEPPRSTPTRNRLSSLIDPLSALSLFDLLLWTFIVCGMALRLWSLDVMEFKRDEFTHMLGAYRAAVAPWSAPLVVSEGTDVSPGIFFYQFLAVPVLVTRDPVSVARFIALVNVAAIPSLFLLIRPVFTARVALWTTAIFATTPWMIVFSRKIWNPDLIVPFLVLTLWCLFSAMQRFARWKVMALAASLALLSQLHLSVWLALLPLLPLGLLFRPWRRPFDLATGIGSFFATFLLTLGTRADEFVAGFTGVSSQQPDLGMTLPQLALYNGSWSIRVPSGFGFGFLLGEDGYASFAEHVVVPWTRPVFLLYVVLAGAGVAFALNRLVRAAPRSSIDVSDRFVLTLLLMACSVHVFYLAFRVAAHPHYHVVLSLLPPLLVGLFLSWMADRSRRLGSIAARTSLIVVLVANVSFGFSFLAFVRAHPETVDGSYGEPYFVGRERWERELAEGFQRIDRVRGRGRQGHEPGGSAERSSRMYHVPPASVRNSR